MTQNLARGFLCGLVLLMPQAAGAQGWTPQSSGTTNIIYEVRFKEENRGIAVGQVGRIMRTTNGGIVWTEQTSGVTEDLFAVDFYTIDSGIAVGNNGRMLRTTDGGQTWQIVSAGTTANLRGISFSSPAVGTVVGLSGIVLRTTNAGTNWIPLRGADGQLYEVDFITDNIGTVVGANGRILHTTDAGASWTTQVSGTTGTLYGVSFSDANHGTIVGASGRILRTTDGGSTWVTKPSGTSLLLTSVQMIDQNLGYVVGDGGLILRTTNGGNTWVQQTSGTTADLKEVSFSDPVHGTVVGSGGTILRTNTGGEPTVNLLLVSPNGGESFAANSVQTVSWNASGIGYVKIELSRNNGGTWQVIQSAHPAYLQSYQWTVHGPASTQCLIRVSNAANQALNDVSDNVFSITTSTVNRSYTVQSDWNLISVPLQVADYSKSVLYPTSSSDAYAYIPGIGYQIQTTLANGPGYWLKFDTNQNIPMSGLEIFEDTIDVSQGWNIIGSISSPVPVASVVTIPPGIIDGSIYGYNNGYQIATTIEPGKGYWVKVIQSGKIVLTGPPSPDHPLPGDNDGTMETN